MQFYFFSLGFALKGLELCNWPEGEGGTRAASQVNPREEAMARKGRKSARARDEIPIRENYCNGCAAANSNAAGEEGRKEGRPAGYAAATFPIFRSAAVPPPSLPPIDGHVIIHHVGAIFGELNNMNPHPACLSSWPSSPSDPSVPSSLPTFVPITNSAQKSASLPQVLHTVHPFCIHQ